MEWSGVASVAGMHGRTKVATAIAALATLGALTSPAAATIVHTDFGGSRDRATDGTVDSRGRVIAVGRSGAYGRWSIARYTADGELDSSFGGDGTVQVNPNGTLGSIYVAVDSTDRILLAGTLSRLTLRSRFAVTRLALDGTPDPTFGRSGTVRIGVGRFALSSGLAVDERDRPVVVGLGGDVGLPLALRLRPDGELDHSFDGDGIRELRQRYRTSPEAVAIDEAGRIVIAGSQDGLVAGSQDGHMFLTRLLGSGRTDTSFGRDGHSILFDRVRSTASAIEVEPNGRILVAGRAEGLIALARLDRAGAPDPTFGDGGRQTLPTGVHRAVVSVAGGRNGRVVAAAGDQLVGLTSRGEPDPDLGPTGEADLDVDLVAIVGARSGHPIGIGTDDEDFALTDLP